MRIVYLFESAQWRVFFIFFFFFFISLVLDSGSRCWYIRLPSLNMVPTFYSSYHAFFFPLFSFMLCSTTLPCTPVNSTGGNHQSLSDSLTRNNRVNFSLSLSPVSSYSFFRRKNQRNKKRKKEFSSFVCWIKKNSMSTVLFSLTNSLMLIFRFCFFFCFFVSLWSSILTLWLENSSGGRTWFFIRMSCNWQQTLSLLAWRFPSGHPTPTHSDFH